MLFARVAPGEKLIMVTLDNLYPNEVIDPDRSGEVRPMDSHPPPNHANTPLAHWREARQWWTMEPYLEFRSYVDEQGIKRTDETALPSLGKIEATEFDFRFAKIRDDKVAGCGGNVPDSFYERQAEERKEIAGAAWAVDVRSGDADATPAANIDRWGLPRGQRKDSPYVPLHLLSGYAFGRSTLPTEEIVTLLFKAGITAAALADPFSLVGAMEFARACKSAKIKPLIGASIELAEGGEIVLIAKSKRGYVALSRLISACHLGEPRGFPLATWERLEAHAQDLICLTGGDVGPLDRLLIRRDLDGAVALIERLAGIFGRKNLFIEVERSFLPWGLTVERQLLDLAEATNTKAVAGGVVTHARRAHFPAQDILVCADRLCLVDEVFGRKPPRDESQPQIPRAPERALNAERFLKTPEEMALLFHDRPDLLENTLAIADMCEGNVMPERAAMPQLFGDDSQALCEIVRSKAWEVYGSAYGPKYRRRVETELKRICDLNSASHFLIAWDFCKWANDQGIAYSGRGSVIDSAVAYVLGLSRIDAIKHKLHFDRFLPQDLSKRPDIDIDFEAKRRDDIRNYVIEQYGKEHVAAVCAIGTYGSRGIIREVGKAFGIPEETLGLLAKKLHGSVTPHVLESALDSRPELRDSNIPRERFGWTFRLAERLMDLPRNIRLHSSGVVLSQVPIQDLVPVMWSAWEGEGYDGLRMIQWDKRSSKHVFDKFDILCLRGQDVLGGFESRIRVSNPEFRSDSIQAVDDPEVYRAVQAGELIGIPQSASPAMRQAHVRLGTKNLHEASLVQAGIRPGVGGAVKINELIARHRGKHYTLEHPDLEEILGLTYGLIVFQEQVDQLLEKFCGYTSGQAEDIRDAIYKKRKDGFAENLRDKIISQAVSRGYEPHIAQHVYELVSQFKGYGFAQGHALAFAEVSLRSIWCQQNHPAPYFASLLDAQPAGYYGPITIANEARNRGVKMLPPDVNVSGLTFQVEDIRAEDDPQIMVPEGGIRTSLKQISGISQELRERILENRPYRSFFDFVARAHPARDELERLILCGALDALHPNRRALLWAIPSALDHAAMVRSVSQLTKTKNTKRTQDSERGAACPEPPSQRANEPERKITKRTQPAHIAPKGQPLTAKGEALVETTAIENPLPPSHPTMHSTAEGNGGRGQGEGGRAPKNYKTNPTEQRALRMLPPLEAGGGLGRGFDDDSFTPSRLTPHASRLSSPSPQRSDTPEAKPHSPSPPPKATLPLFFEDPPLPEGIEDFRLAEKAVYERRILEMDVDHHLMAFERERIKAKGGLTARDASRLQPGQKVFVVGNPIRLRFPPTQSGKRVMFFDLEDETGLLNVTCFDEVYQRDGHKAICCPYVVLWGDTQDRDGHLSFLVSRILSYNPSLQNDLADPSPLPVTVGDFLMT